jgi:hypothetical protein
MTTIAIEKDGVGVGIEGRSTYPVRLELVPSRLSSCFGIKASDAHYLISFIASKKKLSPLRIWTIRC